MCVYIVCYYGGQKLGVRRFEIITHLAKSAVSVYNIKGKERRKRAYAAGSQDSIQSQLSALSYQNDEDYADTATDEDGDDFQSANSEQTT